MPANQAHPTAAGPAKAGVCAGIPASTEEDLAVLTLDGGGNARKFREK
jgi:hypothetical protein